MSKPLAVVVSSRIVSLTDLDTVLGCEDLHDLLEILIVDATNEQAANAQR